MFARSNKEGRKAIDRWARQCANWCYLRLEDGKMADQMYLDEWPKKYKKLHLFRHKGINLAPWNIKCFDIKKGENGQILVDGEGLIFFHFHGFKIDFGMNRYIESFGYNFSTKTRKYIYKPYIYNTRMMFKEINKIKPGFSAGQKKITWLYKVKSRLLGTVLPFYWRLI